ncbi:hypothetical protein N8I77_013049 [Diaporthe amygdali]|uniref:PRISE-like Rossmann-fold domain-containing protein n=1 Tax=Phomopsis amygdali TaxID=1214568 RepID=A0AAD9S264_PHOAM|nr:hypothetical protein N8I77_013049 [Diaporthe amygdali]
MAENHAVVIGASGLIGWGVVNELLSKDSSSTGIFSRVTALVNRPIKRDESFWPNSHPSQPELLLVDGVNMMDEQEKVTTLLRDRIPDAHTITHAFYFVFRANDGDQEAEVQMNTSMMACFINAIESLTTSLKFFVFPGGTRGYGIYRPGGIFTAPLDESLIDTLPDDYAKTVTYPSFRRLLGKASEGKPWTWCEICPDAVIGFAPNGSGWSLAAHWATYLSAWRLKHGEGSEVAFPGTLAGYDSKFTEASTRALARFAIYASVLRPEACGGGRTFNVADAEGPSTMRERWPQIAAWFGKRGGSTVRWLSGK